MMTINPVKIKTQIELSLTLVYFKENIVYRIVFVLKSLIWII